MAFDYAKAVIDNEIALMLKKLKTGIVYDEKELCIDLVREVGPGGSFMNLDHTLKNMKKVGFLPKIATREMRKRWVEEGKLEAADRAMREVQKIFKNYKGMQFPDEVERKIRERFPGLVPGNVQWE
ncbi:trimethylamine methyltransferase family protein [Carboxydothermus ferrireducens]|uniref:Trimethylamine--corrinoid protein Co-methyltransferase n=1 Tax=Carboxydothermus ferrireducens DSM 11255 TaxID=1119529 RepID=A0ABX2RF82_9THEO|nr:trimethylamine methyltransferase family protein [Carboxydothermus ferrireducens]NYE58510.1 trimethylamine--corrinoid protein Co-methyltransferase [Carboxydothermus ferrireducens DSM 11255]